MKLFSMLSLFALLFVLFQGPAMAFEDEEGVTTTTTEEPAPVGEEMPADGETYVGE